MLAEAIFQRLKEPLKFVTLAFTTTWTPRTVGLEIPLGDKADFNFRMTFFLAMGALAMALQGITAGILGLQHMPGRIDAFWDYLQPWLAGLVILLYYLPLRLFGFTRVKFSEYFQVAATNMGPGLWFQLAIVLSVVLTFNTYGTPDADHPFIQQLRGQPYIFGLEHCLPKFDSFYCLNMLSQHAPEIRWANGLQFSMFLLWCWTGARLFHAALDISYWKLTVSFWIMIAMIVVAAYPLLVI